MIEKKFDPKKLRILNNPDRLLDIPPDYILGKLTLKNPEVLVELGAGTAFFCIAFRQLYNPATVYACDISDVMIDWIGNNVVPSYPNIVPVKSEEKSVPLADGIADLVFMITLHHELKDPPATLTEAYRILRPGGEIFIVDWKKQPMEEGPPEEIRCLPEDVKKQIAGAGFSGVNAFEELPKYFLVVGKKKR